MSRKVTYARLQTGIHLPNVGEIGSVLPTVNKTFDNLAMSVTESDSLFISFSYRGIKMEIIVPQANISVMLLAPEETRKSPATSAAPHSKVSLAV